MRIALVYPACHRRGGVERVVWEAARHLAQGHEVAVVCRAGAAEELPSTALEVGVHAPARPGSAAPFLFRRAAADAVAALRPDVVVGFGSECPRPDVLVLGSVHAAWLEHARPVRFGAVTVPAGVRLVLPRHRSRLRLERRAVLEANTIVVVSDRVASDVVRIYHPTVPIVVVPNGFDPQQCSPERRLALRGEARRWAGVAEGIPALLIVANEWHRKGLGTALEAMSRLRSAPSILLLVGREPPTRYEAQIGALGLRRSVRYLGAVEDVAVAYAAGDLLVLPSQYEPFGNVVVEALACGLPVITTALTGASLLVRPDENGLRLADPDGAGELAELIESALHAGVLERWAKAAPRSVAGYEWPSVMDRLEAVITEHGKINERSATTEPSAISEHGVERNRNVGHRGRTERRGSPGQKGVSRQAGRSRGWQGAPARLLRRRG